MQRFSAVVDNAGFRELHHARSVKLGVHAEMFETVKGLGNGVGYASYSQLYGVAVVDKLGYRLAYGKVFFIAGSVGYFGYCVIGVDKIIHLVYRYKDISECAGHVGIDFKYYNVRPFHNIRFICVGQSQRNVSVLVRHRAVAYKYIAFQMTKTFQCRRGKLLRHVTDVAVWHGFSQRGSEKPPVDIEAVGISAIGHVFKISHRQTACNGDVLYTVGYRMQRAEKSGAFGGRKRGHDVVVAFDQRQCLFYAYHLFA